MGLGDIWYQHLYTINTYIGCKHHQGPAYISYHSIKN